MSHSLRVDRPLESVTVRLGRGIRWGSGRQLDTGTQHSESLTAGLDWSVWSGYQGCRRGAGVSAVNGRGHLWGVHVDVRCSALGSDRPLKGSNPAAQASWFALGGQGDRLGGYLTPAGELPSLGGAATHRLRASGRDGGPFGACQIGGAWWLPGFGRASGLEPSDLDCRR